MIREHTLTFAMQHCVVISVLLHSSAHATQKTCFPGALHTSTLPGLMSRCIRFRVCNVCNARAVSMQIRKTSPIGSGSDLHRKETVYMNINVKEGRRGRGRGREGGREGRRQREGGRQKGGGRREQLGSRNAEEQTVLQIVPHQISHTPFLSILQHDERLRWQ